MFDNDYGKYITFHIAPMSEEQIKSMIHFGPSFAGENIEQYKTAIAKRLLRLHHRTLLTIQHIFIAGTAEDLVQLCNEIEADEEMLPESLFDEDEGLSPKCIGTHWFCENTPIVNIAGIKATCDELYDQDDYHHQKELEIGFWTTLLHEIRHNQVDVCPYALPWITESDMTEQAVEAWAIQTFESW